MNVQTKPEPLHLALMDLERDQCRFPYGDGPFTFCGHPVRDELVSYCPEHCRVVFLPRERRR